MGLFACRFLPVAWAWCCSDSETCVSFLSVVSDRWPVASSESLIVTDGGGRERPSGAKARVSIVSLTARLEAAPFQSRLGTQDSRLAARYSPIFLMYSATSASRNRPSGLPAAAAWRTAVAEAG